jgi:hypothetical protein
MPTRTRSETVIFEQPFALNGVNGTQPAGAYVVETSEELVPGLPSAAWRWRSSVIHLRSEPDVTRTASIDPRTLDAVLMRDRRPAAARFESQARQAHRVVKKAFLIVARGERNVRMAAQFDPTNATNEKPG